MTERWRAIPGYEGRYEVSDHGQVRSIQRIDRDIHGRPYGVFGGILNVSTDRKGYPRFILRKDGKIKSWAVHRAVVLAFGPPQPSPEARYINHIDANRENNHISNLEWCTPQENTQHAQRLGRLLTPPTKYGREHPNARPVVGQCIETGERRAYEAISHVARDSFRPGDVHSCLKGRQKSAGGWLWAYAEKVPEEMRYAPARTPSGGANPAAKAVEAIGPNGEVRFYAAASLARADGFTRVGISHVLAGHQQRHRGFVFRYAEA